MQTDTPSQERDTISDDIVNQLRRRGDMFYEAHKRAGRNVQRPFTLEDLAVIEITRLRKELKTVKAASRELIDALTAHVEAKLRLDELIEARADSDTLHAADEKHSDTIVDVMEAIVRVRAALGEGQ